MISRFPEQVTNGLVQPPSIPFYWRLNIDVSGILSDGTRCIDNIE